MSHFILLISRMLIRKPAAVVSQTFIDPAITTNFWFTGSSGPLEVGKTVTWTGIIPASIYDAVNNDNKYLLLAANINVKQKAGTFQSAGF